MGILLCARNRLFTSMAKDSALELISPEIQQNILCNLESLDTLYALIRASPRFYQVFQLNKDTTLSEIALCQFHPAVRSEAVAVATLAQLQQYQSQWDTQSQRDTTLRFCETFPDRIHLWSDSNASGTISKYLCKLNREAKFFINDFARNTLPILHQLGQSQDQKILSEYPPQNDVIDPRLSSTESGRLQRAFCRFELYRRLFSRCSHDVHNGHHCIRLPPLTAQEQANRFLRVLPTFQITEIACVRDYLYRRLRGTLDQLENQAVRTMSLEAVTFEQYDEAARWHSPFYIFTTQAQHEQEEHLEHLVSLGLPYFRRTMESSGDEQRDLFLHYVSASVLCHLETDFLSKALQCLGFNPSFCDRGVYLGEKKRFNPASDENGYSEFPQGWLWAHDHQEPYKLWDRAYRGFRDWGYVFWDYDRLHKSGILRRE